MSFLRPHSNPENLYVFEHETGEEKNNWIEFYTFQIPVIEMKRFVNSFQSESDFINNSWFRDYSYNAKIKVLRNESNHKIKLCYDGKEIEMYYVTWNYLARGLWRDYSIKKS